MINERDLKVRCELIKMLKKSTISELNELKKIDDIEEFKLKYEAFELLLALCTEISEETIKKSRELINQAV